MQENEPITTNAKTLGIQSPVEPPLTRREWLAGMCMQGFLAAGLTPENGIDKAAVIVADALLNELGKK